MVESRTSLPAFKQRDSVLTAISQNQVCKEDNWSHACAQIENRISACQSSWFCISSDYPHKVSYYRLLLSLEKQVVARPHKFHSLF